MPKTNEKTIIDILTIADKEQALNSAVMDFITIKATIQELEAQLDAQKAIIMSYSQNSGINGIKFLNHVIDYVAPSKQNNFNKEGFKLLLLENGVKAELIANCEKKATTKTDKKGYLQLRELKPKK